MRSSYLLSACALCAVACAPSSSPSPEGVLCAGAQPEEAALAASHSHIAYGTAWASAASVPQSQLIDWKALFVNTAHAIPREGDRPAAGWRVVATALTGRHAPIETTTDDQGRYCLKLPGAPASDRWLLQAIAPSGETLRQMIVAGAYDAEISPVTEALIDLLRDRGVALKDVSAAQWLDLRTMADTDAGLMAPEGVDGEGVARRALEQSERIRRAIRTIS